MQWRQFKPWPLLPPSLDTIGKPLMSTGAPSWFYSVSTYGGEVIEYSTNFLIENPFNSKLKIIRE
jgi:hypothetical protein